MKKIVNVTEVEGEGMLALLGQRIQVWCLNYIYEGELSGVNETCILLNDAEVVYETGNLKTKSGRSAEKLDNPAYISLAVVEMFTAV